MVTTTAISTTLQNNVGVGRAPIQSLRGLALL